MKGNSVFWGFDDYHSVLEVARVFVEGLGSVKLQVEVIKFQQNVLPFLRIGLLVVNEGNQPPAPRIITR